MDNEKKVDLTQRVSLNDEDAAVCRKIRESMKDIQSQEQAQRIFAAIREDAALHGDAVQRASAEIGSRVFEPSKTGKREPQPVDVSELPMRRTVASCWDELKMKSSMEETKPLAQADGARAAAEGQRAAPVQAPAAGNMGAPFNPGDIWRQVTQPGAGEQRAPSRELQTPLTAASFYGIWQVTQRNGACEELALGKAKFSIANGSGFGSSWGHWEMLDNPGGLPQLILTRDGWYPSKYHGPLGSSDIFQTVEEVWSVTSISGEVVRFADRYMTRQTADLGAAIQRAGQVQTEGKTNDSHAKSAGEAGKSQFEANKEAQKAGWDFINKHRS